jgi:D-alanyl-D-alanine carboxypeptidase
MDFVRGQRPHRTAAFFILVSLVASAARADQFDDYIRAQMKAFNLPGVSFAIIDRDRGAKIGAQGVSDLARGTLATPDTIYKIASVSKQFIATAIMLLVQDGRLGIDDPISRYIAGTPPAWQPITIRHLLTHTAGLVRESPAFDPMKAKTDIEIIKAVFPAPLRFSPGSKWEYSNSGYYVLAEIVARVSRQPWTEFLEQRIFKPAGMSATMPTNVTPASPDRAVGYSGKDNQQRADEWVALRPSGAFLSNVTDLAKWAVLLDRNLPLTEASRRQMWTPVRLSDGSTSPYGFGWHVEAPSNAPDSVWHGGGLPGFASFLGRFAGGRVTVILLTNGNDVDAIAVAKGLAALYLKVTPAAD